MTMECWYYVAGIASFFVAFLGLIGLVVYACDTRKLRVAAQKQLESTIRPCVLLMEDADQPRDFERAHLIIKNVGAGVGLNIRWRYRKIAHSGWIGCPALAPGDYIRPPVHSKDVRDGEGIDCQFSSLSGTEYRSITTCGMTPGSSLELQHQVELVNR